MKVIASLLLTISLFANCSPEKKGDSENKETDSGWYVVVKGKVGFPQQGQIYVQEIKQDNSGKKDTIQLKSNYTFEKKLKLTEPGYYRFSFYDKQVVNVMVYKTNIELNVDGNKAQGFVEIKGSPDHDLITQVQQMMGGSQKNPEMRALESEFQIAVAAKNDAKVSELQGKAIEIMENEKLKLVSFLKDQPVSLALFNLLQDPNLIDKDKYFDLFAVSNEKFKKEWPASQFTKELSNVVEKLKITAIGQQAPEISLANPNGQIVKLSSLQGKYVLIDFWAKWCGPCRRENPTVVKAYKRFKDKGFEVYGVSLDRNKEDWVKAIAEDGLTWTHVSDLKYFESQAAKDYNINAIPFSILLDKTGKIIAKNLRGAALEKKLEEVLGK